MSVYKVLTVLCSYEGDNSKAEFQSAQARALALTATPMISDESDDMYLVDELFETHYCLPVIVQFPSKEEYKKQKRAKFVGILDNIDKTILCTYGSNFSLASGLNSEDIVLVDNNFLREPVEQLLEAERIDLVLVSKPESTKRCIEEATHVDTPKNKKLCIDFLVL